MSKISVSRKTSESCISVTLQHGGIASDYREKIATPYPFLNHMIEHIVWRSGINVTVQCQLAHFDLVHVVCEDVGITVGRAVAQYMQSRPRAYGFGDAFGIIDEARAFAAISFESRTLLAFDAQVPVPSFVEGINSEDVSSFLEGFVNGAHCTLQIQLQRGENGHHIWEAIFRALGSALGKAAADNAARQQYTAGVAGNISWEITNE